MPGATSENRYSPEALVFAVYVLELSANVNVATAVDTTAPWMSVMLPAIVPEFDCPDADSPDQSNIAMAINRLAASCRYRYGARREASCKPG